MGLGACPQGHTWRSRVEWSPPHLPEEVPRVHPKGTLVWGSRQESLHPDIPLLPPTQCRQGLGGEKGGGWGSFSPSHLPYAGEEPAGHPKLVEKLGPFLPPSIPVKGGSQAERQRAQPALSGAMWGAWGAQGAWKGGTGGTGQGQQARGARGNVGGTHRLYACTCACVCAHQLCACSGMRVHVCTPQLCACTPALSLLWSACV